MTTGVRKFGWGVGDQAVSSLTNFALSLVVARTVTTAELGIFSLAFSTYLIALGVSRVFTTDPLAIRYSTCPEEEWRKATRAATGTAAVIGLAFGIANMVTGWIIGGTAGLTFVALGATLPVLLVQDVWRFAFFAKASGGQSFLNDLVWGIAILGLLVLAFVSGRDSLAWLTASWGSAAGVAAAVGILQAKLVPAPWLIRQWYRANKDLSLPFLGESVTYNSSNSLATYLIGAIAGVNALGGLRAAGVLLGPTKLIISGLSLVAVPEGARSLAESPRILLRTSVVVAAIAGASVLIWGVAVILLPASIGTQILGGNWEEGHVLLIPLTVSVTASAAAIGARSGLRALEAARRILLLRIVGAFIVLSAAVIGAAWAGAVGVANAAAAGETLLALIWWRELIRSLRDREGAPTPTSQSTHPTPDAVTVEIPVSSESGDFVP